MQVLPQIAPTQPTGSRFSRTGQDAGLSGNGSGDDSRRQSRTTRTFRALRNLTGRIAKEAPAVFERMKAGEFRSVRAAAKEAGIVRDPTPLELMLRAWAKASTEEREQFAQAQGLTRGRTAQGDGC